MSVHDKAERLLATGAVSELREEVRAFAVEGDSDTYTVIVYAAPFEGVSCTCPHGEMRGREASCSHAIAAVEFARSSS